MKSFTDSDLDGDRLYVDRADLVDAPLWWHTKGLSQTASGYGKKLTTSHKISFNGKLHRVYCTCKGNAGTCWFTVKGRRIVVS